MNLKFPQLLVITMNLVNLNPFTGITVYVYQKGQMTMPSKTAVYGSVVKMFQIMQTYTTYEYKYRIIQDDLLTLDQPARRCHDDSGALASVSQCIAEYFEAKHNCSLYMLESRRQREDCNESIVTGPIKNENIQLINKWEMKTELEIYQTTGCMPSCKRQQIQLETEQEIKRHEMNANDAKVLFMFQYRDGMYNLNEEYLVYNYNNFIADIGGYLGLLLGHSILSVYSMSADRITKPIRTIGNWLSPGSKKAEI